MSEYVQITSTKNPIVQRFRAAGEGDDLSAMLADGVRLVVEALQAGRVIREIATSPRLVGSDQGRNLRRLLISSGIASQDCSDDVLERLSHLKTHQGVAAIVERPEWSAEDLRRGTALIVVAAGVRDPGNLGALMRTAEAAGASGLIALAGGADPFREKVVRGSAGSIFRLPVLGGVDPAELASVIGSEIRVFVADAGGEVEHLDVDMAGPTALLVGSEGGGVPDTPEDLNTTAVRIAMSLPVESLNVAVAAAVLLYEARRQRR